MTTKNVFKRWNDPVSTLSTRATSMPDPGGPLEAGRLVKRVVQD